MTDISALEHKRGGSRLRAGFDRMSARRLMCGNFDAAAYLAFENSKPAVRGCTVSTKTQYSFGRDWARWSVGGITESLNLRG